MNRALPDRNEPEEPAERDNDRVSEAKLALYIGVGFAIAFAAVLVVLVLLDIIPPFTPFIGFAAAIGATIGAYRRRRDR